MQPHPELAAALRRSKYALAATGVFSMFINLLMLTGPLFMLQVYDSVLSSRSTSTLLVLFILIVGLFTVLGLLELIRSRVLVRIGISLDHRISGRVFSAIMRQSLSPEHGKVFAGALHELTVLRQFITGPAPATLFDSPWVPVYLAIIFMFHWTLGLLALAGAAILFTIALLAEVLARKPMRTASAADGKAQHLNETGRRNAESLAAMGMEHRYKSLWLKEHETALLSHGVASDRSGALNSITKSLRLFLQSAMLAVGAWLSIQQIITPGAMIASSIILGRALQPVEQAIGQWRVFVRARLAYHRLNTLLKSSPEPERRMLLPPPKGHLKVRNIRVAAPGKKQLIVDNVNFDLKPGQIMAIIGPSGSGKSTLARALVDVWPSVSGEIRLDGATFDQWNRENLGKHIGYLPQDVELFDGTVKQNIARFHEDPDAEMVIEAATLAGIHEMVLGFENGYDTQIGPHGTNLSAGQRQRVAVARAVYGNPAVIVLDEPNSNLDTQGDAAMVEALIKLRNKKRTIIVIAHRLGLLSAVDYVLVMDSGKQIAFGPRDEIVTRPGTQRPPEKPRPNVVGLTPTFDRNRQIGAR